MLVFFGLIVIKLFSYLDDFLRSKYYKSLKREIIIDDYFRFIINNKLINASFIKQKLNTIEDIESLKELK